MLERAVRGSRKLSSPGRAPWLRCRKHSMIEKVTRVARFGDIPAPSRIRLCMEFHVCGGCECADCGVFFSGPLQSHQWFLLQCSSVGNPSRLPPRSSPQAPPKALDLFPGRCKRPLQPPPLRHQHRALVGCSQTRRETIMMRSWRACGSSGRCEPGKRQECCCVSPCNM